MTAQDAMEVAMKIAVKHRSSVLEIVKLDGGSDEDVRRADRALNGCEVDLASQIMIAMGKIVRAE